MTILELFPLAKQLYGRQLQPVCRQYGLTRAEMDVLLFLANQPAYDTAADIVQRRRLVKSNVSAAVKSLTERGYLQSALLPGNRKSIHLRVCPPAEEAASAGRRVQLAFCEELLHGFSEKERSAMEINLERVGKNLLAALESENKRAI